MELKEFNKTIEDFVYKEIAKNSNLILGKNKTASLSTGLFLKLPVVIDTIKVSEPLPKMYKELKTFMPYFSAYTKMGKATEVYFTFFYHTEKDLDKINREIVRHGAFLAFVYMHEVQHIIRKHTTSSYETMMLRIANNINDPHIAINIAEDHAINYSLKDLFMISPLRNKWNEIEEIGQYSVDYHNKNLSDIEILKDMVSNAELIESTPFTNGFNTIVCNGKESIQPTKEQAGDGNKESDNQANGGSGGDKTSTEVDDLDNSLSDLSEAIQDIITSNTKGTQAGALFEVLFDSIKVETGWFKRIKASFKRQVYYKTHDFNTSWSNLNNTYRKIYKAPKKQFIDNKINIILSVDHSGSMSTEDLQRLLYLIESESTRIASLRVLIHDTRIIKDFMIEDDYDIASSPEFKQALATRYTSGGTSHKCVFEAIQDMKLPDPSMVMYMSFSDNYSDIEQEFGNYPVMHKLTNYWIAAGGPPVSVPGTNIAMC